MRRPNEDLDCMSRYQGYVVEYPRTRERAKPAAFWESNGNHHYKLISLFLHTLLLFSQDLRKESGLRNSVTQDER
jgi:hypothetical protein